MKNIIKLIIIEKRSRIEKYSGSLKGHQYQPEAHGCHLLHHRSAPPYEFESEIVRMLEELYYLWLYVHTLLMALTLSI